MLITIEEVAEMLRLTTRAVRMAWYDNKIPAPIRIGRRSIRWKREEVVSHIANQPGATRPIKETV